jgi:FkbH-like protein
MANIPMSGTLLADAPQGIPPVLRDLIERGEWEPAIQCAMQHFGIDSPALPLFSKTANFLAESGSVDAGEAFLMEGARRWPLNEWLWYEYARIAVRFRDFDTARERWEKLSTEHPDSPLGICGLATLWRDAGRVDKTEHLLEEATEVFPDYVWAADGYAELAVRANDWSQAAPRWRAARDRFPEHLRAHEGLVRSLMALGDTQAALEAAERGIEAFPDSGTLKALIARARRGSRSTAPLQVPDSIYRCPNALAITPTKLRRVIVIGSSLADTWPQIFEQAAPGLRADSFALTPCFALPELPPHPPEEYDFQVVQLPLRSLIPEASYFRLSWSDLDAYRRLFDDACARMAGMLEEALRWNRTHGMLSFVCNFLVPQQNQMGRLLPRYDLRNFAYFVEKLNEALAEKLRAYKGAYLLDQDQVVATFGRRNLQDDTIRALAHASAMTDWDHELDQDRLEPIEPPSTYYPTRKHEFALQIWAELLAMYRTAQQTDMVKLVLIDLDDTLWRGVPTEGGTIPVREGWPTGFVEALLVLRQRGILLGVVARNDEARAIEIWQNVYGDLLSPADFAVRKINGRPKADNIEDILTELNLLPKSVLFIDDNPVERAAVQAAFPEIRTLCGNPYLWRRNLLWSPETQVPAVTAESPARAEIVQAQIERESQRQRMTRGEFLASLQVRAALTEFRTSDHPHFARAVELINRTSQFNTTGRRWNAQEFAALFAAGGRVYTLDVTDRYTAYRVVGVLVVRGEEIVQFVMSCRVIGMDVELAAVSGVLSAMAARGHKRAVTSLVETPANLPCRDLWSHCGFVAGRRGLFIRKPIGTLAVPAHIEVRGTDMRGLPAKEATSEPA